MDAYLVREAGTKKFTAYSGHLRQRPSGMLSMRWLTQRALNTHA